MAAIDVARSLPFWKGKVEPKPVKGGITNANFLVDDAGQRYFVRVGEDIPIHGVMRFNESAASRAAAACGLSPELLHQAPGALVFRFIEAKTLGAEDVRPRAMLERILPLLHTCHREMPKHVRGPALIFWAFHVVRDYAHTLKEGNSRHLQDLPALMRMADELEHAVGPVDIVFGHNDLLPSNFLDDGKRLWLIDWDYAGFNSPLFDLSNLASNN
jgi:thiamine kinase-like enzyme